MAFLLAVILSLFHHVLSQEVHLRLKAHWTKSSARVDFFTNVESSNNIRIKICNEHTVPFPSETWKICRRSDLNLNGCLKIAIGDAIKDLNNGNAMLEVPPLEPMVFDSITLDQGIGPVGITLKFINMYIFGISRVVVDKVKADYSAYTYVIDFHVTGKTRVESDYISSGRVLIFPIRGVGKCNITLDNFSGRITFQGREQIRNGQKFMHVYRTDVTSIATTKLFVNFRRNKQEALSNILNQYVNINWKQILNDMRPAISKSFGSSIQKMADRIFQKVPFSVVAPP